MNRLTWLIDTPNMYQPLLKKQNETPFLPFWDPQDGKGRQKNNQRIIRINGKQHGYGNV